jgi:uncharacterized protein (TIGR02145 family)
LFYDYDSTGNAHLRDNNSVILGVNLKTQVVLDFLHYGKDNFSYDPQTMTDERDDQVYKIVRIKDQVWMAENLNWAGSGSCYDNSNKQCEIYGRLYTQAQVSAGAVSNTNPSGVQGICPKDWHLPSMAEWQELIDSVGGIDSAGIWLRSSSTLWEQIKTGIDKFGFAALPSGECSIDFETMGYDCFNEGDDANFWTSSKDDPDGNSIQMFGSNFIRGFPAEETNKYPCRCVKDE